MDAEARTADRLGVVRDARFTTIAGCAYDIVARTAPLREVSGFASWEHRCRVIASVRDDDWPATDADVVRAIDALSDSLLGEEELLTHSTAAACADRWMGLYQTAGRYRRALAGEGLLDVAGAIAAAAPLLRAHGSAPYEAVLVDDAERLSFSAYRLVVTLGAVGSPITLAANPDGPGEARNWWRRVPVDREVVLAPPAEAALALRRRIRCHHRSLEGDAVAGEILAARDRGVDWAEIAVLCPSPLPVDAVRRACRRHGIPTVGGEVTAGVDHPVLLTALVSGDAAATATARDLVSTFLNDDVALSLLRDMALSALTASQWATLRRAAGEQVSPGWNDVADGADAVTITSPERAAGRSWHTVVITGAVEGVLPRGRRAAPYFDPDVLNGVGGVGGLEAHERRRAVLEDDRRRFRLAVSRADADVVAVSAPEPGVLVSRFVEDWAEVATHLPTLTATGSATGADVAGGAIGDGPGSLVETRSDMAIWPDRSLRLSATQIGAFENCPLSFAYQYALGARSEGGVQARVGSLVHAILEEVLRPRPGEDDPPLTLERVRAVADELWDPTIFDYRPQAADYRRRLDEWLEHWWEGEGCRTADRRDVVAVEHRFEVTIGAHTLTGSIDRVDRCANLGAGPGIEIVDYKTGSKPPGSVDEKNLQLSVYHLAAMRDPVIAAHGPPRRLRLHYLAEGKDIDQPIAPDHEARTEERILAVADAIVEERYPPSVEADCQYCEFQRLCPLKDAGREVGLDVGRQQAGTP